MAMILGTVATLGGVWALRRLAHLGIVHGLRAPRVPHAHVPNAFGLAPDRVEQVHIPTAGGKRLTGWWALPPQASERPVPAVLVHGIGDRTVPVEDAHRLLTASRRARLLLVEGDHDLRHALAPHAETLVAFLHTAFEPRS